MPTAAYHQALRLRARDETEKLRVYISLRRLEALLGLSKGYLSRLRAGARAAETGRANPATPSQSLVCTLALIAQDPAQRLQELRLFDEQTQQLADGLPLLGHAQLLD